MTKKRVNLSGRLHYHACERCRNKYPDACDHPDYDDVCMTCRTGHQSIHQRGTLPAVCCTTECRLANKDDLETYKLRGKGPWWLCRTCSRQHGFKPRSNA